MKNAPAEFCRIMHQVLGNLKFVEIYLDDMRVHCKTFEEHLKHLRTAFSGLDHAGL